jgi:hypothetical protein
MMTLSHALINDKLMGEEEHRMSVKKSSLLITFAVIAAVSLMVTAGEDDLTKTINNGTQIIKLLTVATDNGMSAVGIVAKMYGDENAKAIAEKVKTYNELKQKRGKEKLIDEEQLKLATEIAGEMAQKEPDWQSYDKSKVDKMKLLKADKKLALVAMADAKAGLRVAKLIPALTGVVMNPVSTLKSSITHLGNLKKAKKILGIAMVAKDHIPLQQKSFTTTGVIVKNISGAEGVGLPKSHSEKDAEDADTLEKNLSDTEE